MTNRWPRHSACDPRPGPGILPDNAGRFPERVTAKNRCVAQRVDIRTDAGFTLGPVVDALSDLFFGIEADLRQWNCRFRGNRTDVSRGRICLL